ncbi:MAG: hypothetical protein HKN39_04845 [Flavobacteriales bacterium]|nr:hypothetical protein [Flavobacteriales bacterium]
MSKIKLYTPRSSERLLHTLDFISEHFLKESISIISDPPSNEIEASINYSKNELQGCYQLIPEGLLFEKGIREISNDPFIFGKHNDILALVFHGLSRYEEYQIKERDEHGRFSYSSLSNEKLELIKRPFLDQLIINWINQLEEFFQMELLSPRTPKAICTFDIDVAYAYRGRGLLRTTGSKLKDVFSGDKDRIEERKKVLKGEVKDPFDTYDLQKKVTEDMCIETRHFFLVSNEHNFDHAIPSDSKEFEELVRSVSSFSKVGIHPSYNSHKGIETLMDEVQVLEQILDNEINTSRQHYLKFDLPSTFQDLIQCGVKEEYSMGYANASLFRAGTSFPFKFYDLENEEITGLKVFPLLWMDSTYYYDKNKDATKAGKRLFEIIDEVKKVGGVFIANWHNDKLGVSIEAREWRDLFLKMIQKLEKAF